MASMTDQMKAVSQNILASKYNRVSAIDNLMSYTGALLSTYRKEREMATAAQNNALSGETRKLAKNVQMMLHEFQQDRIQKGTEIRTSLNADRLGRKRATNFLIGGFRSFRDKSAHMQAKDLKEFVCGLQIQVGGLIKHAHDLRHERGRETAKMLKETIVTVRQQTDEIAAHSRELMKELQHSRIDMGRQLEKDLATGANERQHDVNSLLDGFRTSRHVLQKDLAGAQQAWLDSGKIAEKHVMPQLEVQQAKLGAEVPDEEIVLNIIEDHPEGISASQIGEIAEINSLQVGRIAVALIESQKIWKDKKLRLYFPREDSTADETEGNAS
ncbi:MAG: hypothetical protein Q8K59_12550 [Nitrosomonas sp.]|nr:hypothetical protein [Nitrosomonas sp.]MDP1951895.1 hypothetical protein [Nitrosomonas sp.]